MAGTDEHKVKSLRDLSPSIEPPRDLWPQIAARLKADAAPAVPAATPVRRQDLPVRWLAAAAMVASVAVGVWIGLCFGLILIGSALLLTWHRRKLPA